MCWEQAAGGFQCAAIFRPLSAAQRNSNLHHSTVSCGGNRRFGSAALPLSYGGFTTGRIRTCDLRIVRSIPSLHHAANSLNFFFASSLPCFLTSLLPLVDTRIASCLKPRFHPSIQLLEKLPGGIGVHGFPGLEPEPLQACREVTVNYAIPGHSSRNGFVWIETI